MVEQIDRLDVYQNDSIKNLYFIDPDVRRMLMKKIILVLILMIFVFLGIMNFYGHKVSQAQTQIAVLTYHHLDEKSSSVTITPADFKKHISALKKAGYTFLTATELAAIIKQEEALPPKPLLITFDDGYLSNYTYAYPILKELGLKGTIFVVTDEVGKTPGFLPHFTWEQGKEMVDSGVIDIQSHSHESHYNFLLKNKEKPALTNRLQPEGDKESLDQYEARIRADLLQSKEMIEKNIGNEVVAIAYPYGAHSKAVRYLAQDSGFQLGFITKEGFNFLSEDSFQWKRFNVFGEYAEEKVLALVEGTVEKKPDRVSVPHKIMLGLKRIYLHVDQFTEYMMIRYI